jgi:hypothetical protein
MLTIFLRKFITKIIFISTHFNYNIHFLKIVSVSWRPLLSFHDQTAHRQVHWIHIQIEGIRPHTNTDK